MDMDTSDEVALIKSFVVKEKRERLLGFISKPKTRAKFTSELAHFRDLDHRWVVPIESNKQTCDGIEKILRGHGAGNACHIISENKLLDGKQLPLSEALKEIVGCGMGSLLSCVPGVLAYFEGEGISDRYILLRRQPN